MYSPKEHSPSYVEWLTNLEMTRREDNAEGQLPPRVLTSMSAQA